MIRKIDKYSRISLPKDMQKLLGVDKGQPVNIDFEDGKVIIKQVTETIRTYIIKELKEYNEKLDNATEENREKEIYLYLGYKMALERVLEKYDKLY